MPKAKFEVGDWVEVQTDKEYGEKWNGFLCVVQKVTSDWLIVQQVAISSHRYNPAYKGHVAFAVEDLKLLVKKSQIAP